MTIVDVFASEDLGTAFALGVATYTFVLLCDVCLAFVRPYVEELARWIARRIFKRNSSSV